MYEETFYPQPQHGASGAVSPLEFALYRNQLLAKKRKDATDGGENTTSFNPFQLVPFLDYENEEDDDDQAFLVH